MLTKIICLNIIVKDEAHVIRRCLESVVPFIDTSLVAGDYTPTNQLAF